MQQAPCSRPTPTGTREIPRSSIRCLFFGVVRFSDQFQDVPAERNSLELMAESRSPRALRMYLDFPPVMLLEDVVSDHPAESAANQHVRREVLLAHHPG